MDISPRKVIALFRAGQIEEILRSRTIWICASCYMCTTRCPQSIKITDLLYALKRTAIDAGLYPEKIPGLHLVEEFRAHGQPLRAQSRDASAAALLSEAESPGALEAYAAWDSNDAQGENCIFPKKIKGMEAIRKILAASKELELPREKATVPYKEDMVGYRAVG